MDDGNKVGSDVNADHAITQVRCGCYGTIPTHSLLTG